MERSSSYEKRKNSGSENSTNQTKQKYRTLVVLEIAYIASK